MKHILLFAFLVSTCQLFAQDFVREKDKKTGKVCLRGLITFNDIQDETDNKWFKKGVEEYKPNKEVISHLRKCASPYKIIVFMGTWCDDSKTLIPQFYKVLQEANIDMHAIEIYGVDRNKETLNAESKTYNIIRLPTFIVMHQYREVGRITESVNKSIEEDLLTIMEKDYATLEEKRIEKYK